MNGLCPPGRAFVARVDGPRDSRAALFDNGLCADAVCSTIGFAGIDLQFEYPTYTMACGRWSQNSAANGDHAWGA